MKNIIKMIMYSDIVYADGMTIKDRENLETHPRVSEVLKNINDYYIKSFDIVNNKGILYLEHN